ncbi:hypothetical protein [Sporosarcina sp. 6E9]|uniref:hypothetical protein n=1 Tax=Sporosarcina sp. 6E9 TaxID=2819235 RepID=UPI001AD5C510|nr:hypothetical protein [Sporosarcina sp. 6E9]MBO1911386.1 hypothetical protein [Microvirga sp. 3-52]
MTNYYYLASDQKLGLGNASLDFVETEPWMIPGFYYPVQREIFNGVEKAWELRELLQYIRNYTAAHKVCTVQVAHLLNSNLVELRVQKKSNLQLHEIVDPKQLLLQEGHLLTINKVPLSQ